jgi:hypothetical protein
VFYDQTAKLIFVSCAFLYGEYLSPIRYLEKELEWGKMRRTFYGFSSLLDEDLS